MEEKPSRFFSAVRHPQDLPAAGEDGLQCLRGFVRQRAWLRAHALGEEREDSGVDAIRLGELSGGFREVAHLARIGYHDRKAGPCEGCCDRALKTARRLENHQCRTVRKEALDQSGDAVLVIGGAPRLLTLTAERNIELSLGDIDAGVVISHRTSLDGGGDRTRPALRNSGSLAPATVRALAIRRRTALRLTNGLLDLRRVELPPSLG